MDLRNAPRLLASKAEKFDAIINVGTSIGFHDESYDRQLFRSLTTLTGRGGVLIIETVNRVYLVRHFQEQNI